MTSPVRAADLAAAVLDAGTRAGLDQVGVCDAAPFSTARDALVERSAAGLSGGMQFTYRNPDRSTDPARTLPGARSLVVAALGYATPVPERPPGAQGRVARYATEDHYARLRAGLEAMAEVLRADGHVARVLADDNALVDRAAAVRAGIGWYGRSSNVLVPGRGSWFVLGSVLTDAALGARPEPVADGCGSCTRCSDHCPTGAIVAPGVVDARRCLAWHVQQAGELPHEFRVALDDRMYGCDDCQEVCPPSRRDEARQQPRSEPASPTGASGPDGAPGAWVDLLWVLAASDAALMERLGRWYVARRDPRFLRRNALVALANSVAAHGSLDPHDAAVEAALTRFLDGEDDLLCGHAAWAALRIGRSDLLAEPSRATRTVVAAETARWPADGSHREDGPR